MKKWIIIALTIIAVLVVDLTTKHFLFSVDYENVIPHVVSISSNGGNSGAAWGILSNHIVLLSVLTFVLIITIVVADILFKQKSVFYSISLGFILGGAVGNLVDRLMLGYVRDFIFLDFFPSFPVFNFADSFLTIGAIMMVIYILFFKKGKVKG